MTRKFVGSLLLLLGFIGIGFTGISVSAASAQPLNHRAIRQQLQHKILLLRGRYLCPHQETCTLIFNQQGVLQNTALVGPFSLSAIYVDKITVKRQILLLEAHEATPLRTSTATPPQIKMVVLDQHRLQIRIPIDGLQPSELQGALQTIFANTVQQALSAESPEKRKADLASLPLLAPETQAQAKLELAAVGWPAKHVIASLRKNGVTSPTPIYTVTPNYTHQAKKKKLQGQCELSLILNAQGIPQDIRVVQSLPYGLDQQAITAVSQYRFSPATKNGKPVPIRMAVEIGFHLF